MFRNTSTVIFIIFCVYNFSTCRGAELLRVFQGRDTVPGEFPYAVALAIKKVVEGTQSEYYDMFCTGSIVTPVWTLTAGHCVEFISNKLYNTPSYTTDRPKFVIRYTIFSEKKHKWCTSDIISTHSHPGYRSTSYEHDTLIVIDDVGLVKTNNAMVLALGIFSSVDYRTLYGHKVTSVGYGLMQAEEVVNDTLSLNKPLQVYDAMIVKCSLVKDIIRPSFCISWDCNKPATSCSGDSGAPVIHPYGIIGVLTAGDNEKCNTLKTSDSAGIATPLSPFLNWIAKQIQET